MQYAKGYVIFSGGGTGFVGSQLIKSLSLEGVTCTCISRMPGPSRMSWVSHIQICTRKFDTYEDLSIRIDIKI